MAAGLAAIHVSQPSISIGVHALVLHGRRGREHMVALLSSFRNKRAFLSNIRGPYVTGSLISTRGVLGAGNTHGRGHVGFDQ